MQATILDMVPGALSDYYDWLKDAPKGAVLVYWRGDLQYDRQIQIPYSEVLKTDRRLEISALNVVASRILADAKAGHLTLTQKKIGESIYEYRATRKRRTYPTPVTVQPNDHLVLA